MLFIEVIQIVKVDECFKRVARNTFYSFNREGTLEYGGCVWDEPTQDKLKLDDYLADDWVILCNVRNDTVKRMTLYDIETIEQ